ncbi:MAG: hypothetical protein AAF665_01170 [Pseudomonadota bacterium]
MTAPLFGSSTRHDRLFELIRQKNQAETTVARANGMSIRKISKNELEQLQRAAERSLRAAPKVQPAA